MDHTFPGEHWEAIPPEDAGFSPDKLAAAGSWLNDLAGDKTYQVAVSRNGRLVGEWYQGTDPDESHRQASAAKSYYSSMLGVAVADGKIGSPDDKVVDHHPELIEEKIRNPIRGKWGYKYSNFKLHPEARLNIFGYYTQIYSTARDLLRIGHLWMNWGNWQGEQVIPEAYLKEATVTNSFILENEPEENWKYGHGFWVNDHGKQWPDLPTDSFAASGAGAKHTWVCPPLGIVVVQNPGLWDQFKDDEEKKVGSQNEVISRIINALE